MSWFVTGIGIGMLIMLWLTASAMDGPNRDQCRAAHPGFDCSLGWVVGERFQ